MGLEVEAVGRVRHGGSGSRGEGWATLGSPARGGNARGGCLRPGLGVRRTLGEAAAAPHLSGMRSRPALAAVIGVLGFLLYIGIVVALADHVLHLHWTLQVVYFAVAGIAWTIPAKRLIAWAVSAH